MHQPLEIFINGIAGVFAGMVVLYLSIKLISLLCSKQENNTSEGDQ